MISTPTSSTSRNSMRSSTCGGHNSVVTLCVFTETSTVVLYCHRLVQRRARNRAYVARAFKSCVTAISQFYLSPKDRFRVLTSCSDHDDHDCRTVGDLCATNKQRDMSLDTGTLKHTRATEIILPTESAFESVKGLFREQGLHRPFTEPSQGFASLAAAGHASSSMSDASNN